MSSLSGKASREARNFLDFRGNPEGFEREPIEEGKEIDQIVVSYKEMHPLQDTVTPLISELLYPIYRYK